VTKPRILATAFSVFLLVMVGAAVYMVIGMSNAQKEWVAQDTVIEADVNALYGNTISVTRLITSEGLDEHITVDGMTTDCKAVSGPTGWNIECPEDILAILTPESAATPTPDTQETP
jgi:hypothetical protein